jgi:predicted nucleic acid-binding protein
MIILDTNVVSEPLRAKGDPLVTAWLDSQPANTLYLTSTSLSELLVGVELLPEGKRKAGLGLALTRLIDELFGDRILPFDAPAAFAYAKLIGKARATGQGVAVADGQIAALAMIRGFAVATRDTAPFSAAGVPVIDPWNVQMEPAFTPR